MVTAGASLSAAAPVATTTTVSLTTTPAQYGDVTVAIARVALDGPVNLTGHTVTFLLDGAAIGSGVLLYTGSGAFSAFGMFSREIPAGAHTLAARFDGYVPATGDSAAASTSAALPITVAQAPSTTAWSSVPTVATVFSAIDVTATVSSPVSGLTGTATLYGDSGPLATANVAADGTVHFDDVVMLPGVTALRVGFDGDAAGNYASSSSGPSPLAVIPLATSTTLRLSDAATWAGGTVTATVDVRAVEAGPAATPRELHGTAGLFVDGVLVATAAVQPTGQSVVDGARAQFSLDTAGLALGAHAISARFVPMAGFDSSRSTAASLQVRAISTTVTPAHATVSGTPSQPASVMVQVSETRGAEFPASGSIQPFVGGNAIGSPVTLVDGSAELEFAGLPVGGHQVEVRFVPDAGDRSPSAASVQVDVVADPVPTPDPTPTPDPIPTPDPTPTAPAGDSLAVTGGAMPWLSFGIGTLLLAAGILLSLRRRRSV